MILGSANAVNLTDGLDGLAAGSAIYAFICYMVIGFWGFRHSIPTENIYHLDHAYDLSICAAAMAGACAGFLWWNANPARIIMGDTGALAIGTGLAALALMTSTELLLLIVGGLFVHRDPVRDRAGDGVPAVRWPARVPHGADPPSLRARRLAGDDRHRALLDPRRPVHRARARLLLRGLPACRGRSIDGLASSERCSWVSVSRTRLSPTRSRRRGHRGRRRPTTVPPSRHVSPRAFAASSSSRHRTGRRTTTWCRPSISGAAVARRR